MSKHPLYNTTGLQEDNKSHVLYALANKQMERPPDGGVIELTRKKEARGDLVKVIGEIKK